MADVFVGPIIEKLIDIGFEYLKHQFRWQKGMKEELKRLQKNLPQIQSVVHYASTLQQLEDKNPPLNTWLWQLRDAIDEADDVMEELEYLKLQKQLIKTEKQRKVRSIMRSIKRRLVQIGLRALKIDPTLKRLEEVVHKLDEVSAGVTTFLKLAIEAKQEHQEQQLELKGARVMGPLPKNVLIGRDNKEFVMNWLRKTSNENQTTPYNNISLLSIVGQGGMGKTTLLQHVYNESDEKEFDLKIWASVSNDFNKNKVIKDILEFVTKERPSTEAFGALQQKLQLTVNSKKFLLVLDDIWEEDDKEMNKSKWEDVLAPLASGKLGSKISVTTRMESVAIMLSNIIGNKNEMLRIEGLNDDECLQLLYNHAFNKGEDPTAYPKLRPIAERIVKKLSRSPLAAKVIGGVLSSRLDEIQWNRVLNYEIGNQKGILDILKLSYTSLPKVLQSCFSFCCTFPQDCEFDKDDLVRMWIALGFIQPDKTRRETMKDAGERYFDDLVQKSLFDKFQKYDKITYRYKLHDLLHEMLRTFSTQECLSIVGGEEDLLSKTPKTIRHLFVRDVNSVVLRKVVEFQHLRSFILIYSERHEDLVDILAKIFKQLRSIRLICIGIISDTLKMIPKEIEDLIHLQYLRINSDTKVAVSLPALWRLPFLKYLFLSYMSEVKGFDYKFHGNEKVRVFPSLQVLHIDSLRELKDWFVAKASAYECLFPCLTELHLKHCPNLLELPALPQKLEKVELAYIGWKCSNWLQGISRDTQLPASLPPFWQLPFLKSLYLANMPEVKGFDYKFHVNDKVRVFPSLQVLHIECLPALEDWFVAKAASYECLFPCLTELHLRNCPNLLELPSGLPPKLEKLKIDYVGWKGSNWLQGISTNYCNITIIYCPNLYCLEGHQEMDQTTGECQLILSALRINDPSLLLKLPLTSVTSIQNLEIEDNNEVISFSIDDFEEWFLKVSSSLCELGFSYLESLQFLPSFLENLSSLEILRVEGIPLLQQLPNMPASLKILFLFELPKLRELPDLPPSLDTLESGYNPELKKRYQRLTGSDWPKIAHIPQVHIY